jgi:hypothetical protein
VSRSLRLLPAYRAACYHGRRQILANLHFGGIPATACDWALQELPPHYIIAVCAHSKCRVPALVHEGSSGRPSPRWQRKTLDLSNKSTTARGCAFTILDAPSRCQPMTSCADSTTSHDTPPLLCDATFPSPIAMIPLPSAKHPEQVSELEFALIAAPKPSSDEISSISPPQAPPGTRCPGFILFSRVYNHMQPLIETRSNLFLPARSARLPSRSHQRFIRKTFSIQSDVCALVDIVHLIDDEKKTSNKS